MKRFTAVEDVPCKRHCTHSKEPSLADEEGGSPSWQSTTSVSDEQSFPCKWQDCTATLASLELLDAHVAEHFQNMKKENKASMRKGYRCLWSQCESGQRTFRGVYNLEHHVRFHHTGYRPHRCPEEGCEARFVQLSDVKYHAQSVHGEKKQKKRKYTKKKAHASSTPKIDLPVYILPKPCYHEHVSPTEHPWMQVDPVQMPSALVQEPEIPGSCGVLQGGESLTEDVEDLLRSCGYLMDEVVDNEVIL